MPWGETMFDSLSIWAFIGFLVYLICLPFVTGGVALTLALLYMIFLAILTLQDEVNDV